MKSERLGENRKMIFHIPFQPNRGRASASQIRPFKMKAAFESLGYDVAVVMGKAKERKSQIARIKERVKTGEKFDFLYSESSTMPTLLTEDHHLPLHPFLDFGFFRFCKENAIAIGLFYRDIYWMFPEYKEMVPWHEYVLAKMLYRYDLRQYAQLLTKVYLPSINMAKFIPTVPFVKFDALPPGHEFADFYKYRVNGEQISLLYVGGVGPHYQMHELFYAVKELPWVNFTLCTRKEDWDNNKFQYLDPVPDNIQIVHKKGEELVELYDKTDIAVLFVQPQEYREFAAPVKLYEYLGLNKPIIATSGTLTGDFVDKNDIGWTIPYAKDELKKLLLAMRGDQSLIGKKAVNCLKVKASHTWEARAEKVINDLTH